MTDFITDLYQELRAEAAWRLASHGCPELLLCPISEIPGFTYSVQYAHKEGDLWAFIRGYGLGYFLQELEKEAKIYND